MDETAGQANLLRLLTWLSPAFPVGAFAYSHGLERAIHDGVICDRDSLTDWLTQIIERGSGWNDAVLLVEAWRADDPTARDAVAELAEAMAGSRERHMEATLQGEAFGQAAAVWESVRAGGGALIAAPYPVAVGAMAARHGVALEQTLTAYLHAFVSNLIQAAVRLVPLGQRDGIATMATLEPAILGTAARASLSTVDDLGSASFMSEVMAMKHETQYSRVFRS